MWSTSYITIFAFASIATCSNILEGAIILVHYVTPVYSRHLPELPPVIWT